MCSSTQPWKEKQADQTENRGQAENMIGKFCCVLSKVRKLGPSDHKELPNEVKVKYKSISNSS